LHVLNNASDAVAGSSQPRITLTVAPAGGMVRFEVRDNGSGISPDRLQTMFQPFRTTKEHGLGLGLVIVKKMLANMSGTVDIMSTEGEGTQVVIALPEGSA